MIVLALAKVAQYPRLDWLFGLEGKAAGSLFATKQMQLAGSLPEERQRNTSPIYGLYQANILEQFDLPKPKPFGGCHTLS